VNSTIERVEGVLKKVEYIPTSNPAEVESLNTQAVEEMMLGNTEQSLALFFEALEKSGSNLELRARSLINIGDWVRRIEGSPSQAQAIFALAEMLPMSVLTQSRLKSMQAMAYIYRTELGKNDPDGIEENIRLLREAIDLAQAGYEEDSKSALHTESFAAHRLVGTVSIWGTPQQKQDALVIIDEFLPKLNQDSTEAARFNCCKARIIADERPIDAASLLVQSAERMDQESPLDAGDCWARAGVLYALNKDWTQAGKCWLRAEEFREALSTHKNSARILADMGRLKTLIDERD